MKIEVSCLRSGKRSITAKQLSRKSFRERPDVQQEIRRLLIKYGLTQEDVISKYKEIIDMSYKNTKTSDVLRALENVLKMYGIT